MDDVLRTAMEQARLAKEREEKEQVPEYQYKIITLDQTKGAEKILNPLGEDGWELTHVVTDRYGLIILFLKLTVK